MTCTVRGISTDGRSGSINQDGHKEYSVIYKVVSDNKRDGPAQARVAFGIPSVGDLYLAGNDFDNAAVVIGKEVNQGDSPFEWLVEVRYSTDLGQKPPQQYNTPLDEPPDVNFGFQERRVLVPGYYNTPGSPPADGAFQQGLFAPNGELFDPQPEVDVADPILSVRRNVQTIVYSDLMALANCVNSDVFQGATPRQLRFLPPSASRKYHRIIGYYWELSYSLAYRWETWDIQVLNQGTYYWSAGVPTAWWGSTALRQTKQDGSGNPLVVNLTAAGNINNTHIPTFTRVRYRREINFSSLGILT